MRYWSILLSCLLIAPAAAQSLNEQLNTAVEEQQWDQAIGIIDRMIESSSPEKQQELESYRDQLELRLNQSGQEATSVEGEGSAEDNYTKAARGLELMSAKAFITGLDENFIDVGSDDDGDVYTDYRLVPQGYKFVVYMKSPLLPQEKVPVVFSLVDTQLLGVEATGYGATTEVLTVGSTGGHNLELFFEPAAVSLAGGSGAVALVAEPEGGNYQAEVVRIDTTPYEGVGVIRVYEGGETSCIRYNRDVLTRRCELKSQ